MPGIVVVSCGILTWRSTGFWHLTAVEVFDGDHCAATFRARLARRALVLVGAMVFTGCLAGVWLRIKQAPDLLDPVSANAVGEDARKPVTVET